MIQVRKLLDEINELTRQLPSKFKSYQVIEWLQEHLVKLLNYQAVLREVCSEALKDRHWKLLLTILGILQIKLSICDYIARR